MVQSKVSFSNQILTVKVATMEETIGIGLNTLKDNFVNHDTTSYNWQEICTPTKYHHSTSLKIGTMSGFICARYTIAHLHSKQIHNEVLVER